MKFKLTKTGEKYNLPTIWTDDKVYGLSVHLTNDDAQQLVDWLNTVYGVESDYLEYARTIGQSILGALADGTCRHDEIKALARRLCELGKTT